MDDAEIIALVAASVGGRDTGGRVQPLGGKQGLLVCRVILTGGGSYIFKAVKEAGRREVPLSALLSRIAPEAVPRVFLAEQDEKRGLYWLVTEDVGSERLADAPTIDGYLAVATTLARLQLAMMTETESLRDIGIPGVDGSRWEEIGLRVLEGLELHGCGLSVDVEGIGAVVWSVPDMNRQAYAGPPTLVHGDLHAGNIVLSQKRSGSASCRDAELARVRLLDWGSAYVGAAFLGLEELLLPACRHLRTADQRGKIRAAYLREWSPLLGKPGPLEPAVAACATLVHLELLDEALRRPHQFDDFAIKAIASRLLEAYEAWQRT